MIASPPSLRAGNYEEVESALVSWEGLVCILMLQAPSSILALSIVAGSKTPAGSTVLYLLTCSAMCSSAWLSSHSWVRYKPHEELARRTEVPATTTIARSLSGATFPLVDVVGTEAFFLKKKIAAQRGVRPADVELVIGSRAIANNEVPFPTLEDVLPLSFVIRGSA